MWCWYVIGFFVKYIQEPDDVLGESVEVWTVLRQMEAAQKGKADVCLVGPQIRYDLKGIRKDLPDIPVEMIEMRSYGRIDGKAILKQAQELVKR